MDNYQELEDGQKSIIRERIKSAEPVLDRVGLVKQKEPPDLSDVKSPQNLYQEIHQTIVNRTTDEELQACEIEDF